MSLLLGVLCAAAASALYCLEVALQALEARVVRLEHSFRLSLLTRLVRRPRWTAAAFVGTLGWPLQAVALLLAPLTLVQPALGLGLILLLAAGGRLLDEPVGRREVSAVAAILAGVAGLAFAAPARTDAHARPELLVPALAALAALAFVPYLVTATRRGDGLIGAWAAGLAFAWSSIATKLFSDALSQGAWPSLLLWLGLTGIAAGVGVLSEMSALQHRPVTQVAPVVFAVETLVPVLLAPLLVGEHWPSAPPTAAVLVASLAAVVAGTVVLDRSPALEGLLEASARTPESEFAESPSASTSSSTLPSVHPVRTGEASSVSTITSPGRSEP